MPSRPLLAVARDRREAAEIPNVPSAIQLQLRHVRPLPLGLAKCGVLVRLNTSARTCSVMRGRQLNWRCTLKSRLAKPGPRSGVEPRVAEPRFGHGTERERVEVRLPGPISPRIRDVGPTLSAIWLLFGRLSDVAEDVTVNGEPEYSAEQAVDLPAARDRRASAPPLLRNGLPSPNGSSATNERLEVVRPIVAERRFVQVEVIHRLHLRRIVGELIAADAEGFRPRVGDVHLVSPAKTGAATTSAARRSRSSRRW